jgi:hypothetical protein
VRRRLPLVAVVGLVLAPTSSAKEVGAARPPVALSVSPAHIAVVGPASRVIRLRNVGSKEVAVDTARRPFGVRRAANAWLTIVPARQVIRPRSSALFTLRANPRHGAAPGDHHALLLLTASSVDATHVRVRMRLGIVVRVRVTGPIVHRLELRGVRVRRHANARVLIATVLNRGNVSEEVRGRVTISLVRAGRLLARLRIAGRELRPATHALFRGRYAGRVRGVVTAVVTVRVAGTRRPLSHAYRVRL